MSAFLRLVTTWVAAALLSSCVSPRFEKAWEAAAEGGSSGRRWEGRWQSDRASHGGRLRAVLKEPVQGRLEAFFEAGWHGFTTAYPVSLEAIKRGRALELKGEHQLRSCIGGGTYVYSGSLEAGRFFARYTSSYDTGSFALTPSGGAPSLAPAAAVVPAAGREQRLQKDAPRITPPEPEPRSKL